MSSTLAAAVSEAREQSLGQMIRRSASRYGAKTALVCGSTSYSYRLLDTIVDGIACGLLAKGLRPGDRIAILSRNSHHFATLRFGAARAGLTLVPVNVMLKVEEIAYVLRHSRAKALFVDHHNLDNGRRAAAIVPTVARVLGIPSAEDTVPTGLEVLDPLPADRSGRSLPVVDRNDVAQIIYTSGTESLPKGVLLTHESLLWQYQTCAYELELRASDVFLHTMPMFHCAQLDTFLGPCLMAGATNVIAASPSPDILLPLMREKAVTSFFAPPTIWISLLSAGDLAVKVGGTLAKAYYGASIMPPEVLGQLRSALPDIRFWNCYGQSEIAPLATVLQPDEHDRRPGSVGKPVINVETRLVNDQGGEVGEGETGEIVHRSPQLMTGYLDDPDKTAAAFEGGWFHSGDLAVRDAEGFLWIVDRKKDMIKTGGENVASSEVENALHAHPAVAEAAVVGLPDPRWIEAITAVVVLRPGSSASADDLIQHCRGRLAHFKSPKSVVFVDAIPRNASGKLLKRELREWIANGGPSSQSAGGSGLEGA
jgi:fatty-acyl-CoA synthase